MTQHRDLVPVTVYVPRWLVSWASMRARVRGMSTSAFLRMVLISASRDGETTSQDRPAGQA